MPFDYEDDDPNDTLDRLAHIVRASMIFDVVALVANLVALVFWLKLGNFALIMLPVQLYFLVVSGRSFLSGFDEIENIKALKAK